MKYRISRQVHTASRFKFLQGEGDFPHSSPSGHLFSMYSFIAQATAELFHATTKSDEQQGQLIAPLFTKTIQQGICMYCSINEMGDHSQQTKEGE